MTSDQASGLALVLLIVGVALAFGSVAFRLVRLRQAGIRLPRLIWRDVAVFGGMSVTFVAVGIHRVADTPFLGQVWWVLLSAAPAIIAIGVMVYFEFFVIGHRRDGPPEITDHGDGQATITTSGPSTITVEPDEAEP